MTVILVGVTGVEPEALSAQSTEKACGHVILKIAYGIL